VVVLHPTKDHNINLRSAFLHLLADSLGSVAAIAAGLAIYFQGWYWADPLAAAVIAVLIIISSWRLVKEAADILMEATPGHIDLRRGGPRPWRIIPVWRKFTICTSGASPPVFSP
jgi:cobalt-zinc-cadmium efflux system protein